MTEKYTTIGLSQIKMNKPEIISRSEKYFEDYP
jgi:hypothetical protein